MKKFSKEDKRLYPKEVIEALDGSIEKWYGITFEGKRDRGRLDCPLCQIFNNEADEWSSCSGCPIADESGDGCINTPYSEWEESYTQAIDVASVGLAYNFYKWLKNLRENVGVEEEVEEKVTKCKFIPFTLTIETLEEAKELYHRFYGYSMDDRDHPTACPYPGLHLRRLWGEVKRKLINDGHIT